MELKPIQIENQEQMLDMLTSEKVNKTFMLPDYPSRQDALPLFRRLVELSRDQSRYVRGIYAGDILVGFLNDVENSDGTIELGYVIHPEHWGKGCMTAALRLAIADLFRLGYRQVVCGAFRENVASIRVMEKAGMEKLQKTDEIEYRGKLHQCVYYSIYA